MLKYCFIFSLLFYSLYACRADIQPNTEDKSVLVALDSVAKDGYTIEYYKSSGLKKAEGLYQNEKREGRWKFYRNNKSKRPDNIPYVTGEYKNGIKDGKWVYKYPQDPSYYFEGFYSNDTMSGRWSYFTDNRPRAVGSYHNGMKNGVWLQFDDLGLTSDQGQFKNGFKHGWWQEQLWDKRLQFGEYDYGKKTGTWELFIKDHRIAKGEYRNDKKEGFWIDVTTLNHEGKYVNGLKEGLWKDMKYEDPLAEYYYEKDVKVGSFKRWDYETTSTVIEEGYYALLDSSFFDTVYIQLEIPIDLMFEIADRGLEIDQETFIVYDDPLFQYDETYKENILYLLQFENLYRSWYLRPISGKSGTGRLYHDNGKLHWEGNYEVRSDNSSPHSYWRQGEWRQYNYSGDLVRIITYNKGKIIKQRSVY